MFYRPVLEKPVEKETKIARPKSTTKTQIIQMLDTNRLLMFFEEIILKVKGSLLQEKIFFFFPSRDLQPWFLTTQLLPPRTRSASVGVHQSSAQPTFYYHQVKGDFRFIFPQNQNKIEPRRQVSK